MRVTPWTDERVEQAATLWNDNQTAAQIAVILEVTRNAIIGLAHRRPKLFKEKFSGVNTGRANGVPKPRTKPRGRKPKVALLLSPADGMVVEAIAIQANMAAVFDAGRQPFAKSLMDLMPCECRWPVTRTGPHLFCAEVATGAYCTEHRARSVATQALTTISIAA